jgi:hypothetical protein
VIGIDVYPYPMPEVLPPNVDFQLDDLNRPYVSFTSQPVTVRR